MFGPAQGLDPGYTSLLQSFEISLLWSAHHGEKNLLVSPGKISSTATDSGNTNITTTLRAGLILGIKDSDGFYYKYDPTATDGTQIPRAILPYTLDMLGAANAAVAKTVPVMVRGNIIVANLVNYDAGAGKRLIQLGFNLDAPAGAEAGEGYIGVQEKGSNYTVVAADNGKLFLAITGAVTFTLPTKAHGLAFEFLNTVNNDMIIATAGSADDIVADGDAGADQVAFSTSSHKIGSRIRVECRYLSAGLVWLTKNLGGTTETPT